MFRSALAATVLLGTLAAAQAHFVFILPDTKEPSKAVIVLSDELAPDENVTMDKVKGLVLTCRDAGGKDVHVPHAAGKHELTATLPGSGPRIVFGSVNYGVMQKGEGKAFLLAYHPKAVIGPVAADKLIIGPKGLPVELVPVAAGSQLKIQFLAAGKAQPDTEVTVIAPDGKSSKVKTDATGHTPAFAAPGRYGAWAKSVVAAPGTVDEKKYEEARHYATLVVDVPTK